MRSIKVQMNVGELQVGNRVCDALLIDWCGLGTELVAHVRDGIAERVGLEDDGKSEVLGGAELLRIRLDELILVQLQTTLVAAQFSCAVASAAVPIGEVIENKTDSLLHTR
jgi:hypothetical protein